MIKGLVYMKQPATKIELKRFSDQTLAKLARMSRSILDEIGSKDTLSKKIYRSWSLFRKQAISWTQLSEEAFNLARSLTEN